MWAAVFGNYYSTPFFFSCFEPINQLNSSLTLPFPPLPLQIPSISPLADSYQLYEEGESTVTVLVEIEVPCSWDEVLAYSYNITANCRRKDNDVECTVVERVNSHSQVVCVCKEGKSHGGLLKFHDREYVNKDVYKVFKNGPYSTAFFISSSCEHEDRPIREDRVKGMSYVVKKIKELPNGGCELSYLITGHGGGSVPAWVVNFYAKKQVANVVKTQQYFLSLKTLEEFDELDWVAIGEACMLNIEKENNKEEWGEGDTAVEVRIKDLFLKNQALRELASLYPAVVPMVVAVVTNKFRKSPDVDPPLSDLTQADGRNIGRGLAMPLMTNTSSEAAVDEWIHRYTSLQQLDVRYSGFRSMVKVVAARTLEESRVIKGRTYFGAGLSMSDMVFDIIMMVELKEVGETGYAYGILITVILNTSMQLFLVYLVNRKMSWRRLLRETITTLLCLKPAIDGKKQSISICVIILSLFSLSILPFSHSPFSLQGSHQCREGARHVVGCRDRNRLLSSFRDKC